MRKKEIIKNIIVNLLSSFFYDVLKNPSFWRTSLSIVWGFVVFIGEISEQVIGMI